MPQTQEDRDVQEVVRAHAGWVFACAKRRVRDDALAEDVAQAVFILFWQKGARLGGEVKVTGWLYRAVRYCAANALRLKQIRQRHEREAAMAALADRSAGTADWDQVSPELEWAVDRLRDEDRAAVLLRFYRQMSLAEVGESLGISEEAAKKRVQRAVGKLRGMLAKNGVTAGVAALGVVMAEKVTAAAPTGLVEAATDAAMGAAGGSGTGAAGIIAKGARRRMARVRVAAGLVLAVLAVVGGGVTVIIAQSGLPATQATGGLSGVPSPQGRPVAGLTVTQLAERIAGEERKLQNLVVDSEMWIEAAGKDEATVWKRLPVEIALTAWRGGLPGGQARLDVHREVLDWVEHNGPEKYAMSSYSVAFDGHVGRTLVRQMGTPERTIPMPEAQIEAAAPARLRESMNDYASGAAFSIYFYRSCDGRSLSEELLKQASLPNLPVRVSTDKCDGIEAIRVQMGPMNTVTYCWWFDPTRSYALLAFRWTRDRSGGVTELVTEEHITKLVEASPGIWYPTEAYRLLPQGERPTRERYWYHASRVVANDPHFDPTIFTLQVPPACRVIDLTKRQ